VTAFSCLVPALNVDEGAEKSILGIYDGNGLPAIITSERESGRVALVGAHPEIEENDTRDGSTCGQRLDDCGSDWPILERLIDWLEG
jgi:hypothetical protein